MKFTDEQIISALLKRGTALGAAHEIGANLKTVQYRLAKPEFQEKYRAARIGVVREAAAILQSGCTVAVATLISILNDTDISPQIRVNAAQMILTHAMRFTETIDFADRLEKLEKMNGEMPNAEESQSLGAAGIT